MKYSLSFALLLLLCSSAFATRWPVGATRQYKTPSSVMSLVHDGDTVAIDSGMYSGDVGVWNNNDLVIYCPEGRAHLNANGAIAQKKGIWVFYGNNNSVEGIEFYGASISASDGNNGAGIRMQGSGLTLRNCYFHDNQDGILTGAGATSDIVIEACEFAHNGAGDGYSHNMYIGNVRSFRLTHSYVHEAVVGHEVKSRANNNFIAYNLIADRATGSASYDVDLPNGGRSIVLGNSIMKGPQAQNHELIRYGEEGLINPDSELYVVNNTMLTELGNTIFITVAAGAPPAMIENNIFAGAGAIETGAADTASNVQSIDTAFFHFRNATSYDFQPVTKFSGSTSTLGMITARNGQSLQPTSEYVSPLDSLSRSDFPVTVGAYALGDNSVGQTKVVRNLTQNFPNPFSSTTTLSLPQYRNGEQVKFSLLDVTGKNLTSEILEIHEGKASLRLSFPEGVYNYFLSGFESGVESTGKLVIMR